MHFRIAKQIFIYLRYILILKGLGDLRGSKK